MEKAKISVIVFIGNQINFNLLIGFFRKAFYMETQKIHQKT